MGILYTGCKIANPAEEHRPAVVSHPTVDAGAETTWIDGSVLSKIGIEPRKKDLPFQMANGQIVTRSVGYAVLKVDKSETVDEVVLAQKGDLQWLGARALEGLNLKVDSRGKRWVAAGPMITAAAVSPRFAKWIQVRGRPPEPRRKKTKLNLPRHIRKTPKT